MKNLSNVDLALIDCVNPEKALAVIGHCSKMFNFGNVKLFTHVDLDVPEYIQLIKVENIDSIEKYSDFCLRLNDYIDNDYLLLIQIDGFILNPEKWDDNFLCFDFVGAPFPLYYGEPNDIGNGGFCLRSKFFLEYASQFQTTNGAPEDRFLVQHNYDKAIECGIIFPPTEVAFRFSAENYLPHHPVKAFDANFHFGWHGKHLYDFVSTQKPELKDLVSYLKS